jgi:hypothetical protein
MMLVVTCFGTSYRAARILCSGGRDALQPRSFLPSVAVGGRQPLADSVPLVFEYEQKLKRDCAGGALSGSDIDDVLQFLCANANLSMTFNVTGPDSMHRQIVDLAARQQFLWSASLRRHWRTSFQVGSAWSKWPNAPAERFLAALDKVLGALPAPEDRI